MLSDVNLSHVTKVSAQTFARGLQKTQTENILSKDIFKIQKQPPKVFLKVLYKIVQNSHESTCVRVSFLINLQVSGKKSCSENIWKISKSISALDCNFF